MDRDVDVVVIGAGFAGLRALHTLRERGMRVAVLESGGGVGGVWYWNRYPGARCDVESYDYSYGFSPELEQEWRWTERYAAQPEILAYAEHVADRFDLNRDVWLGRTMTRAAWDGSRWQVDADADGGETWTGRHLIMAVGNLSTTKAPDLPGSFDGRILHASRWPHEGVDLSGERVGILGTGSTGMQMTPPVAEQAAHLTVFQRTANFSIAAANEPLTDERDAEVKAHYRERREAARNSPTGLGFTPNPRSALEVSDAERRETFEQAWRRLGFGFVVAFPDLILDERANDTAADFIREKIASKVDDPGTRETLTPRGFPFGTKRPSVDSGYFETFNRDDVTLVDVGADPIARLCPSGVELESGAVHRLDTLVFATGFDAMTGSLLRPEIVGSGGLTLREAWASGPRTFLGLFVHGFPNFYVIAGPGSPSLLSNVLHSIEQHVDWLADLLDDAGHDARIEASEQAQDDWVAQVEERANGTLYPRARSYYMGDEMDGKPRVFMPYVGGVRGYRRILERTRDSGYQGLTIDSAVSS